MDPLLFRNLLAHAAQAALLTIGATLLARAVRRAHPQLLLGVWQAVLIAMLVLPFVQPWRPAASQLVVTLTSGFALAGNLAETQRRLVLPGTLLPLVGWLLAAGIVMRLIWMAVGIVALRRLVAHARRLEPLPGPIVTAMRDTGTQATFCESDVEGPLSFGFRRGVVLVPPGFAALDARSQYLVAFHELLHVRRRDAAQCLLEETAVAILWFYPWVWWVRNRIRLAREQVVDRATAGTRPVREAYIRALLGFAGRSQHQRALPTASGMWRTRELRARIDALYKEVTMSRSRVLVSVAAMVVGLGSIAVLSAMAFPLYAVQEASPQPPDRRAPAVTAPSAAQDDEAIRVGGAVKPPKKTRHVNPVYPPDAKEAGIQGVVIIEARIDKEGKVAHAEVVRSIPELDQAALDAVLQWEFEPTHLNGKPVAVIMTVTINFTLE